MLRSLAYLIVSFAVSMADHSALAQSTHTDGETCYRATLTSQHVPQGIDACSRAIDSGEYNGAELAKLYANRGIKHRDAGDPENALSDFNFAIELERNEWRFYQYRGIAQGDSGDFHRALEDCGVAVQMAPEEPYPYVCRGWALDNLDQLERAHEDYRRALELLPMEEARGTRSWLTSRLDGMQTEAQ